MKKTVKYVIAGCAAAVLLGGGIAYAMWPEPVDTVEVVRHDVKQYVKSTGTISADEAVTVYAPVAGKLSAVSYEEGDTVSAGDLLAEYDLTGYTNAYHLAAANEDYYADGYDAAVKENNKAKAKYDSAVASADDLRNQYTQTRSDIDAMDKSQAGKNQYIASTLQGIESAVANMETELAEHQAKGETASATKSTMEAQLAVLESQSCEYQKQIKALEAEMKARTEEYDSADEERKEEILKENQAASESIAALQAEKTLVDAQISPLKSKIKSLEEQTSGEKSAVSSLTDRIAESRDTMATLPVEGMTESEYARYAALLQKLDMIERDWNASLTNKEIAEEKLLNDSQIAQYEDSVEIARLQKEAAEHDLNQAKAGVKTECGGVILKKLVNAGAAVEAGQELYVIQPSSGYKVTVMISKYDIGKINIDQTAEINQGNTVYEGRITKIYPVAETDASGKPKVKVDILIDDSSTTPIIGLEAEVTINAGSSAQTLAVPVLALYADAGGDFVYVYENKKAQKHYVTVGIKGTDTVEILDGLQENDQVVTSVMDDN